MKLLNLSKTKIIYLKNTAWLLFEKLFRMGIVLGINVLLARYLGVSDFGFLAYSLSLLSTVMIFTHLGLAGVVIKELVLKKYESNLILATVFYLKLVGAILGFFILIIVDFTTESIGSINFYILLIISLSIFFKPFSVIESYFLANVEAKYISISTTISLIITTLLKVIFMILSLNFIWIAFTYLIENFLIALNLLLIYFNRTKIFIGKWNFSLSLSKELLSKSWMIMLGSFFATIYLKSDQIMIKWILGNQEVGIYAVASSLSEVWYFLPSIIVTSLFPKIIEYRESNQEFFYLKFQQLLNILFIIALSIAIIVTFISKDVILFLYGSQYAESGIILSIHIWAGLFIFMREAFSKWIIMEDLLHFSIITHGLGMLLNIGLNLLLIPNYGIIGAAIATIVSYAMASYISLLFFKKTRIIFYMMTKAIFFPFYMRRKNA